MSKLELFKVISPKCAITQQTIDALKFSPLGLSQISDVSHTTHPKGVTADFATWHQL